MNITIKERRELRRVIRVIELREIQKTQIELDINRLKMILERMYCGCLTLDCQEHGSYNPNDLDFLEKMLTFKNE